MGRKSVSDSIKMFSSWHPKSAWLHKILLVHQFCSQEQLNAFCMLVWLLLIFRPVWNKIFMFPEEHNTLKKILGFNIPFFQTKRFLWQVHGPRFFHGLSNCFTKNTHVSVKFGDQSKTIRENQDQMRPVHNLCDNFEASGLSSFIWGLVSNFSSLMRLVSAFWRTGGKQSESCKNLSNGTSSKI